MGGTQIISKGKKKSVDTKEPNFSSYIITLQTSTARLQNLSEEMGAVIFMLKASRSTLRKFNSL